MNLYIFRHGTTYFSKNGIPYGDKVESAEILPEGIPAVKRIGKYLKEVESDANFTSPFKRCIQTAKIVSEVSGKNFVMETNLRDWDPRKESKSELIERINQFTNKLDVKNYKSVAICTHGYPINALIAYFTKGFVREADLDGFPDPGVLVTIKDKKADYKDFNH